MVRPTGKPSDCPGCSQSLLAAILRSRSGKDFLGLGGSGRSSQPSGIARSPKRFLRRVRMEDQGLGQTDRPLQNISPILPLQDRAFRQGSRKPELVQRIPLQNGRGNDP